ncbi:MAG: O-antigen ligase family protein [Planctomycetota bacterium]
MPAKNRHLNLWLAGLLFLTFIAPFDEGAGRDLVPLTALTVAAICLGAALVRGWLLADGARPPASPALAPLCLFLAVAAASAVWSIDAFVSLTGAARVLACTVAFLLVLDRLREPWHARALCTALVVLAVILAVRGIWEGLTLRDGVPRRAQSVFVTPNTFAGFLIITLPMAAALAAAARTARRRAGFLLAAAALALALALSQSRGAWVAGAAGMCLLGWELVRRRTVRLRPAAIAALAALALAVGGAALALRADLRRRILSTFRPHRAATLADRFSYWDSTLDMIAQSLPLGIGLDTYYIDYPAHRRVSLAGSPPLYAHNDYLQVLAELGIVGFAALLWLLWRVARMGRQVLHAPAHPAEGALLAACCAGAGAALLHSLVDFNLYVPATALPIFICFGVIAAAHSRLALPHLPAQVSPAGRRIRRAFALGVLAAGTAAVFCTLRPLAAQQFLKAGRFNAPFAVALCPISSHFRAYLGDTQAATHLAVLGMAHVPGDAEAARRSYLRAIELSPRDAANHARLARLMLKNTKLRSIPAENNSGLEHLRRACALDRHSPLLRWQLAAACLRKGLLEEAHRELRFCIDQCRPDDRLRSAAEAALPADNRSAGPNSGG